MKKLIGFLVSITLLVAQSTTRTVTFVWTAVSGAVSYNVYKGTGSGALTLLNTSPITTTTFSDNTIVIGTTYSYAFTSVGPACVVGGVVGSTPCGEGLQGAPITFTTPPRPTTIVTLSSEIIN